MSDEAEDRTQAPSNRRRAQARELGQAAHSPELTGAVGLLAATAVLGFWTDRLFLALLSIAREPLRASSNLALAGDPSEVVARLRETALALAGPLGVAVAAFGLAALLTHQAQVRGLWAPGLLAPDPARLWTVGRGPGLLSRGGRGVWSLVKAALVTVVALLVLRSDWHWFQSLGRLDTLSLARAIGHGTRHLLLVLASATVLLGLIDFALQHQRLESLLRLSPEQHREDMRAVEGDPALRSRRRRLARSLRADSPEVLAGATLILTGPSGLTVVLAGGPPPRPLSIRSIVSGPAGAALRRSAARSSIPQFPAPALARRLAQRRPPNLPPAGELLAELYGLWNQAETS